MTDTEIAAELVATKNALNAAYRERAHLVALLARQYPSHIGHTDPNAPDWAVLTVELATGQACWHIAPADMDLFGHVQPTPHYARGWDGHSTEEKYQRIDQLVAELHPEAEQPQDGRDNIHTASAAANLRVWLDSRTAADTLGRDVRAVLDNREQWRNLALSRGAKQDERDGDVRAVRALTQAASRMLGMWAEANDDVRRELWTTLHDRADDVFDRYRERYAALDAKAGEQQ